MAGSSGPLLRERPWASPPRSPPTADPRGPPAGARREVRTTARGSARETEQGRLHKLDGSRSASRGISRGGIVSRRARGGVLRIHTPTRSGAQGPSLRQPRPRDGSSSRGGPAPCGGDRSTSAPTSSCTGPIFDSISSPGRGPPEGGHLGVDPGPRGPGLGETQLGVSRRLGGRGKRGEFKFSERWAFRGHDALPEEPSWSPCASGTPDHQGPLRDVRMPRGHDTSLRWP